MTSVPEDVTAVTVPEEVRDAIAGVATVGFLDQAFVFLTADDGGPIDVCLLSRTELRATATEVEVVVASSKARRNLAASRRATLVAVTGHAAHYLGLEVRDLLEDEDMLAARLGVTRVLRDDLGVELHPMRFRVEERLRVEERWEATSALLDQLDHAGRRP